MSQQHQQQPYHPPQNNSQNNDLPLPEDSNESSWLSSFASLAGEIRQAVSEGFDDTDVHGVDGQAQQRYSVSPTILNAESASPLMNNNQIRNPTRGASGSGLPASSPPQQQRDVQMNLQQQKSSKKPTRGDSGYSNTPSNNPNDRSPKMPNQNPLIERSNSSGRGNNSWFGGWFGRSGSISSTFSRKSNEQMRASPSISSDRVSSASMKKSSSNNGSSSKRVRKKKNSFGDDNEKRKMPKSPKISRASVPKQNNLNNSNTNSRIIKTQVTWHSPRGPVAGKFTISEELCQFEPDFRDQHVRDHGIGQFQIVLDVSDIHNCAAISLPWSDSGAAYMMELHLLRTNGFTRSRKIPNPKKPLTVVFQFGTQEELYSATQLVLEYVDQISESDIKSETVTNCPMVSNKNVEDMLNDAMQSNPGIGSNSPMGSGAFIGKTASIDPINVVKNDTQTESDSDDFSNNYPKLENRHEHTVLTPQIAAAISDYLPISCKYAPWRLNFSPRVHGKSMHTFYRNFEEHTGQNVMLVRTTQNYVFGCFCSSAWKQSSGYFGNGECCVFFLGHMPDMSIITDEEASDRLKLYPATLKNNFFQYSDEHTGVAVGGGGSFAITIDCEFLKGTSAYCSTFHSPCLCQDTPESVSSEHKPAVDFTVKDVEWWCFSR